MRVGSNPNRDARVDGFSQVVLCVVTHLPEQKTAYHSERLEVIQKCLTTMRERAGVEHTFMVWDNGSVTELRDWLRDFRPDVLITSGNIGKTAARASMIKMLPPGSIVAYSDDDIYYYENWLEPQIELLQHFPNVSAVTGYPVRTAFRWGVENTIKWAQMNGRLDVGKLIPREWEDDFARSLGRDPGWHAKYTLRDMDVRVTYNGKSAYCTAHHCQFVAFADKIAPVLFYDGMAMGDEKRTDIAFDQIGLRLATTERLSRHIGNRMEAWCL